jgi:hypothetical protein
VSDPTTALALDDVLDELITLVAERNFDFYEASDGKVKRA